MNADVALERLLLVPPRLLFGTTTPSRGRSIPPRSGTPPTARFSSSQKVTPLQPLLEMDRLLTSLAGGAGAPDTQLKSIEALQPFLLTVPVDRKSGWRSSIVDPRAHLRHAAEPEPMSLVRRRAFGEAWAALSVGMLIVLLAIVVWLRILPAIVALPVLLAGYLAVEAFFDRSVGILLLRIAMILAIVAAIILAVTFVRELVLIGLLGLGLLLILDNLGELRRRAR